jgi:zinc protease
MKSQLENKSLSPESAFQDSMRAVLTSHNKRSRPLSAKMLDEINYKRVHKIYRERFEDPSSFTFVFVGNINLEKAKPLIEKYLGSLPNIKKEEQWKDLNINYPKGKIDKKVVAGTEPKSIVLMQINHDFDYNQKDRLAIKTLGTILSIDLIEEVREKMSVVYTIGAYPNYDKLPTPSIQMTVYFPCAPENIEPATNKTLEIFKKISAEGPSDVNLEKARQQLLKARETNLRENRYWLSTIKNYNFYNIPFKEFGKTESIIKKINKDDIKATAKKYLNTDNYTRVYLVPKEKK